MLKVLKFTSYSCKPCKQLNAALDSISSPIPIESVDLDLNPERAVEHNVRGVPVCIKLDGDREIDRIVGPKSREFLMKWLGEPNAQ